MVLAFNYLLPKQKFPFVQASSLAQADAPDNSLLWFIIRWPIHPVVGYFSRYFYFLISLLFEFLQYISVYKNSPYPLHSPHRGIIILLFYLIYSSTNNFK